MTPGLGIEPGTHWWKASALTTTPTLLPLHKGNTLSAEKRMGKEDGGLARHTTECQSDVDWGNAEIVARERGLKQRKILEGIESVRQRNYGMRVLNNFDHVDPWKPILNSFFDRERNCKGR